MSDADDPPGRKPNAESVQGSLAAHFLQATVSTGAANLATLAFSFIGLAVAARHLPPELLGAAIFVQLAGSFLTQVTTFGLDVSATRLITSTDEEHVKSTVAGTAICFRLLTVIVVGSAVALALPTLSPLLATLSNSRLVPDLAIYLPLLLLAESSFTLVKAILQGLFLFAHLSVTIALASLLNLVFILAFILLLDDGPAGLVHARLLALVTACAFAYASLPIKVRLRISRPTLRTLLVFGFPLQVNDLFTFMFQRADTFIIGAVLGPADLAYYSVVRRIPDSLGQLYESFRLVYFTFVSRLLAAGTRRRASELLNSSTALLSSASAIAAFLALLFGPDLLSLLFGRTYVAAFPAFAVLMIALSASLVGSVLGNSLVAAGDSTRPAVINVAGMVVSLVVNIVLVPVLGTLGAAVANLAASCATNPLNVLFLRRLHVDVRVGNYLKPMVIFIVYSLPIVLWRPEGLGEKVGLVAAFVTTSLFVWVQLLEQRRLIVRGTRLLLSKHLRS